MERLVIFHQRQAPDATLAQLAPRLERLGFQLFNQEGWDLCAKRGLDRVHLGVGPHRVGLAVRVRATSLLPGRGRDLYEQVTEELTELLGRPARATQHPHREEEREALR